MDEIAAMEAFPPNMFSYAGASGITLASDNNENNASSDILTADKATIADNSPPPATAAEFQMKMPWANQVPHYMYNFQNPMQQVPPYPAYPFSGAHPVSPYYPEHVRWPVDGRINGFTRKSHKSKKKGKSKNDSGTEDDKQSESGISGSETDTDESGKHDKKHSQHERALLRKKKKSSKTVVIRNINYITSNKRNGEMDDTSEGSYSDGTAELDEDDIRQEVVDAVSSFKRQQQSGSNKKKNGRNCKSSVQDGADDKSDHGRGGEKNENWNAFQNILMRQEKSHPNEVQEKNSLDVEGPLAVSSSHEDNTFERAPIMGFETGKVKIQHSTSDASVIETQRDGYNDGKTDVINITNVEERRSSMRTKDYGDVQYAFSQKSEDFASSPWRMTADPSADSSLIRNGNREDWFIVNQADNTDIQEAKQIILDESNTFPSAKDSNLVEANKRASIDDSFMVQSHQSLDGQYESEWRSDVIMESESGFTMAPPPETCSQKSPQPLPEPDDLCVMLARDSVIESSDSWTPEMDYGIETSFTEVDKRNSVETNTEQKPIVDSERTNGKKALKTSGKEARSRLLQGTISRGLANSSHLGKKPSSISRLANPKCKVDKEEETRKRMEELVLERQKRIAERSASGGVGSAASKKVLGRSKTATSMMQETRRLGSKPVSAK
ncbi:hypothetical protein Leryth_026481 [Lithospermum erythrorhizon]|nr:hypothetical protein Leryth_026481 [Lithospermum erythrorhizon]